jgi:hypothetical protein
MRRVAAQGRRSAARASKLVPGLAVAVAAAACSFSAPPPDNTAYRCPDDSPLCPDGFACVNRVCVDSDTLPDASMAPDSSIPTEPVTLTIGERDGATVRNVTTDTYLTSSAPTATHGDEGVLRVDGEPAANAVIRFEPRTLTTMPLILSATLTVYVEDPLESGTVTVHALELPWAEANASWDVAAPSSTWPTPGAGGVAVGAVAVAATSALGEPGDVVLELATAVVQTWVDTPGRNHGLRLSSTGTQNLAISSSESSTGIRRPLLTVTYRPR